MPLSAGSLIGSYEILAPLGKGGMGEVYRARDTKLKREVAIKVLPETFTSDPGRLGRFQREAEVLASLDHPNIGAIHGLVDSGGTQALVLALIEGPTLDERIAGGPLPLAEAAGIAKQIIAALEYAHDRGVIHRDLKPANVKVTSEGVVKVLDFGLAKVLDEEPAAASGVDSPTMTLGHTRAGVILGTAAYMSPEQAVGKAADRRSDIFSFGAVFYEMLTGRRAFTGDSAPEILVAVAKDDPDWSKLPASTPDAVLSVLKRCLTKDRRQRFQAIGEARIALENPMQEAAVTSAPAPSRLGYAGWLAAALFAIAVPLSLWAPWRAAAPPPEVFRYHLSLPPNSTYIDTSGSVVSPDGRKLAFTASPALGAPRIWVQGLDSVGEPRPLSGTEGNIYPIFWSYDSRWVIFALNGKLMKVDTAGGSPVTLCDLGGLAPVGGSENASGKILFGTGSDGIWMVPSVGGALTQVTKLEPLREESAHNQPKFLPDGRHFLYFRRSATPEKSGTFIGDLETPPEKQSPQPLILNRTGAHYAPARAPHPGYVLFVRDANLFAQPFDEKNLKLMADPVRVSDQVGTFLDAGVFSVASNGVLVLRQGVSNPFQLAWFDRQGKRAGSVGPAATIEIAPTISPPGTQVVVSRLSAGTGLDLWRFDLDRNSETQLTVSPSGEVYAIWSPDGKQVVFSSNAKGHYDLYRKEASGGKDEMLLLETPDDKAATNWSRDGRFLLYTETDPKTGRDIWVLSLDDPKKKTRLLGTPALENFGSFSPNMHWMAYSSTESGGVEQVFVRELIPEKGDILFRVGPPQIISRNGGSSPAWRGDGKELFFAAPDGTILADSVAGDRVSGAIDPSEPMKLFQQPTLIPGYPMWTVTNDGQRFLFVSTAQQESAPPFTVVVNWQESLGK